MTSKIIVNNIQSDTGVSTVTIASPVALSGGITGTGFAVGTGASISSPATNVLTVSTNNVERVRVDSGGRLGIGTNIYPNNEMLVIDSVNGNSAYNTKFVFSGTTNTAYCAATWTHGQSGTAIGYAGVGGSNTGNPSFRNTFVVGTQNANALVLNTNDAERLRIDSSGRVTKPYQPGFEAVLTSTSGSVQYTSVNSEIVFNSTNSNVGNHYNTSTGRFTAPVTGNYMFYMFGMTTATTWYNFRKNGSPVTYPTHSYSTSGTGSPWAQSSGMTIISLNVGDYVSVFTGGAGSGIYGGGNNHNVFVGYLLG
jgi:hypothetical protein